MLKSAAPFVFIVSCSFLLSCAGENKELVTPKGVLSRDSMVQAMASLHIAESQIIQSKTPNFHQDLKSQHLRKALQSAGVDTATFRISFEWYASHPELFATIYDDILSEISKRGGQTSAK